MVTFLKFAEVLLYENSLDYIKITELSRLHLIVSNSQMLPLFLYNLSHSLVE